MYDVVIVGAGPAGLAAAISCREWDLNVLVIDEFPKPGGRLLGQLHEEPSGEWWNGIEETQRLLEKAQQLQTEIRCGISVTHLEHSANGFQVYTSDGVLHAENLLLATGAAESPAPIPGWTLPGVMSIGAAQVMTNVHRVRVGNKGVIVGINVLSAAIARELQLANIHLQCMALPALHPVTAQHSDPNQVMADLARIAHLAPSKLIQFASPLLRSPHIRNLALKLYPKGGVKMWGMPVHIRKAVTRINGTTKVQSVTLCKITDRGEPIPGTEETVEADFVCIAGGLYPLAELAAVVGCPFQYIEALGGHVPLHNERMETPIDGLYVAGNITGIESAKVARAQGTLAGLSIAKKQTISKGLEQDVKGSEQTAGNPEQAAKRPEQIAEHLEQAIRSAAEQVQRIREQASIQFHPDIAAGRVQVDRAYQDYCAAQGGVKR